MASRKTAKKTTRKKKTTTKKKTTARETRATRKKKKVVRKRNSVPPMERFEQSPRAPWPWPLRHYQQDSYDAFTAGKRRQALAWHRRAGKDVFCLSLARDQTLRRVGGYIHFFPKHVQAKRAIWNGVDPKKGARFIDVAFGDIEVSRNNAEMFIEMVNGSTWQLLGSDNYDRVVGSNAVGVVFSEFALCDPRAWDFIRPIILENDGYAMFISTFRGRNHMWQMVQDLASNPEWYVDVRTVDDTTDIDGNPIMSPERIQAERDSGMSEALIQQEYYCNPEATADGAIYGPQLERLKLNPHRNLAHWHPNRPVYCAWNLDLPVYGAHILFQPGQDHEPPQVLRAGIDEFKSLSECFVSVNGYGLPVMKHLIMAPQAAVAQSFQELNIHAEVMRQSDHYTTSTLTGDFLDIARFDGERTQLLVEALGGYVRRESFQAQTASVEFGEQMQRSWHAQLAVPLEYLAAYAYAARDTWQSKPDYSTQDRISRVLLPG